MNVRISNFIFPIIGLLAFSTHAQVEHRPYKTFDSLPHFTQKPYLIDPTIDGMTVAWFTDIPSQSKVVYGKSPDALRDTIVPQKNGLIPVDTHHAVRLENLEPGETYYYKPLSRAVLKLNPYWPDMGKDWLEGDIKSFQTFDPNQEEIAFSVVTDTHEHTDWIKQLMNRVDWDNTDFFVETGDAMNYVRPEEEVSKTWLAPIAEGLSQTKPFIYARGNHDLRGPNAREWFRYTPIHEGRFYYTRNIGPAHFMILDSGEDKPDTTNVYAGLNNLKTYKKQELKWFQNHVKTSESLKEAPFRIVLIHDPNWGWNGKGEDEKWTQTANEAGVDLVIAGHWHRFKHYKPMENKNNKFPILVIGQKQIVHIKVNAEKIFVRVEDMDGKEVDTFEIDKK